MRRILVVDDERLVADTLALVLRKNGFDALAVYSGEEALRCATTFDPELLLCDISMPGKDGVELMSDFYVIHPDCRILVLTGTFTNIKRVRDRAHDLQRSVSILTKPCPPAELLRTAGVMLSA